MPKTIYELFEEPEFLAGSQAKREQMFADYKATEVAPYVATLPDYKERRRIEQEVDDVFAQSVIEPQKIEGSLLGIDLGFAYDAGIAAQASVDQLQAMGGEVAAQLNESVRAGGEQDAARINQPDDYSDPERLPIRTPAQIEQTAETTQAVEDIVQPFIDENVIEGQEVRSRMSEYARDKKLELQELMDAAPTDAAKAGAAVDFYLMSGNLDMLGVLTAESAAPTAAAIGVTIAGGVLGGPVGAAATASLAEGALGAGEASLGAYQKALSELKKQGVPEEDAKRQAREASRTAAAIGGIGSAVLGPVGEALPVIRSFGRGPVLDNRIVDTGITTVGGVGGEFAQGALVQVAENIAVDPITPTGTFDGVITAGTLEALAAAPTVVATQATTALIPAAVDAADEIMQSGITSDQLEDALSEAQDQETRIPDIEVPETTSPVDTGAVDSTGSSVPPAPAERPGTVTPPADTGAATGDTGSTQTATPAVSVPEQPASPDTPDVTIATPETPATPAVTGNGADIPAVSGEVTGGDGVSSPETPGGDGVAGQPVGNLPPEVVAAETTTTSFVEPEPQYGLQDDQEITELEDFTPPDLTPEQEWSEYELDTPYAELPKDLQAIWKDQVANFVEDPTFPLQPQADQIMVQFRNRQRTETRTQPAKRRNIPDGVGEYMVTGTTEDAATLDYVRTAPLPVVLTNTLPAAPLPQGMQVTQGYEAPGAAGILNAAIKRSGAERGTYLIAEPAAGVAHVMSRQGTLISTVPYKATGTAGTVSAVNGPMGVVPYERVKVKQGNAKVTKRSDGVAEYEGMVVPAELEDTLKPKGAGFSGSVYIMRPEVEATVTPPNPPIQVSSVDSPLPAGAVTAIMSNSTATQLMPVQDVIDAVLADPDIVNWPQYAHQLRQLRPHVADYNLGHDTILDNSPGVMGHHSGGDRQIMLKDGDGFSYHTLTHEIAHAATVETFKKRSALTDPIWQQLEAVFELVNNLPGFEAYGLTNPKEFVAQIYTNENFRTALDSVQGIKQDKTLWDQVRDLITGDLFAIDQFDSRQLVDWTEALFETNEKLIHDEVTPLAERGRTFMDVAEDRHSDDYSITWTRRGLARLALSQKLKVRKALLDKDTPLLKFLALETWLPRTNADYDTYKSWTLFNLAGNVKKQIVRRFTANHIRRINEAHSTLYRNTRGAGLSAAQVRDIAATYVTVSHIPNATDVQRNALIADVDKAQEVVDAIETRQAAGEIVPELEEADALAALRKAEFQLLKFDEVQAGIIQNVNNQDTALMAVAKANPYTVMGGATKIQAYRIMDVYVDKLTPPNGDKAETRAELERMRQLYIEANRAIWQRLIAEGEVSQEQADAHAASGLDRDYIPLTGAVEVLDSDSDNYRAFGTKGAMQAPVEGRRAGRLSKPENADFSLQRKLDNMASRVSTRPFRQQLLADIQSGNIPPAKAQWTLLKGKNQYSPKAPEGIRPLHLRTDNGTYQFWLQSEFDTKDATVMDAINGIGGADSLLTQGGITGAMLRATGRTTRAFALAYTHATSTFAPINFMREGQESLTNITARDLSWTDENGVEQTVDRVQMTAQVAKGMGDPKFFQDTWRVYRNRAFSNVPIESEELLAQSRLGKKFLEAEAAGAINIEIDAQLAMFQAQDMSSKDKKAIQQITRYAGEVQAAALKEGKLSPATIKAMMQEANARNQQGFEYLFAALQLWNRLFDVRVKVAIYDALTTQGMPSDLAAARVLDLANYNKEGDVGKLLSAISPFWRSKVFGAANTLRTAGAGVSGVGALTGAALSPTFRSTFFSPDNKIKRKQKTAPIVSLMVQASILFALGAVLRMLAGDDEEDPDFKYNKLDAVQPFTNRGNLSIALGAKDGESQQYANVPVGYGMTRILHVTAQQLLRKGNDSPLATNEDGMQEVFKTILDETLPTPMPVTGDETKNVIQWLMLSFTPEMLQSAARTGMNIGPFGNTLDFAASNSDEGAGQGYFRTPEAWVSATQMMNETLGTNWTPQQTKGYLMTLFPGPLAAIPDSVTAGDREVKGLPETNRDELGMYNVLGLSRLYGRASPPEINAGYTLAGEFVKERAQYAKQIEAVAPRKRLRSGKPSTAKRKIAKVWKWDEDKLAEDGKLYLLDQADLYDDFDKARKKIKRALNDKDKEIRQREHQKRLATGDETWAWAVAQEAYNDEREFWDEKYLEERALFKNFVTDFHAIQRTAP